MALHDALHDREPHSGSLELLVGVEALEDAEELVRVFHFEPRSVVPDEVGRPAGVLPTAYFDGCGGTASCELPGVPDQVRENLEDQVAVRDGRRHGADR